MKTRLELLKMDGTKSRTAALDFLDYLAQKGLIAKATAEARKAAVGKVLAILDDDEAADVTILNIDELISRFSNLHGKSYTPQSLVTYKSRVKSSLDDFARYVSNPLAFKSGVQPRERKGPTTKVTENTKPDQTLTVREPIRSTSSINSGPMSGSILPIPIRADLTVYIQGLPFDLNEAEAKKIGSVVAAMVMPK